MRNNHLNGVGQTLHLDFTSLMPATFNLSTFDSSSFWGVINPSILEILHLQIISE